MINDLPTHGVIPSIKSNCSELQSTQYSAVTCFFLEKSRGQKPRTVLARLHRI